MLYEGLLDTVLFFCWFVDFNNYRDVEVSVCVLCSFMCYMVPYLLLVIIRLFADVD